MSEKIYDAILCYSEDDLEDIKTFKSLLDIVGIKTWFEEEQTLPGEGKFDKVREGFRQSRNCIIVIGNSKKKPWEQYVIKTALITRMGDKSFRVMPVLLPNANNKPNLSSLFHDIEWVDLKKDYSKGLRNLILSIRGTKRVDVKSRIAQPSDERPSEFIADVPKVVSLLAGESLYRFKDVFIREILQNAVDACERRRHGEVDYLPKVIVRINNKNSWIEVDDNGEGMNEKLLRERFLVIGRTIREEADVFRRVTSNDKDRISLIANFGIGFISTFIGSEKTIVSTTYDNGNASQINLEILDINKIEYPRSSLCALDPNKIGTTVRIYLKKEFRKGGSRSINLLKTVQHYVRHGSYIEIVDGKNRIKAPHNWNLSKAKNVKNYKIKNLFEARFGINIDEGSLVFSNGGFFICKNSEVVIPKFTPKWVVGGVNFWPDAVDLNLARDSVMQNSKAKKLKIFSEIV